MATGRGAETRVVMEQWQCNGVTGGYANEGGLRSSGNTAAAVHSCPGHSGVAHSHAGAGGGIGPKICTHKCDQVLAGFAFILGLITFGFTLYGEIVIS